MTEKNRNFRSSYYDKVGFRGVEEKKSLEILINEKPLDLVKLSKFCLRFTLPSMYRELVWKVLLGVVSVNTETHAFILNQRFEQHTDTKKSLEVMNKITDNTPRSVMHTLMYLMTQDVLLFEIQPQLDYVHGRNLIAIASVFLKFCSCEVTSYWLFKKFILQQNKFSINIKSLKEQLDAILKKEDAALYEHLKDVFVLDSLPLNVWFGRYFSEILHHTSLIRVFDKVIGGSYSILSYIGSAILLVLRQSLFAFNLLENIMEVLKKIPEDTSDVIVSKAFDLYYS